jgi:hypothetical protein
MVFDNDTLTRLLGSIDANRLVLLCGAGLSIPSPSDLMSAVSVSRACYDKYAPIPLPPALRDDIDQLAGHFHSTSQFKSVFLGHLVPWNDLTGKPNHGHAAVADFLICRAAEAALSANFDTLIENWANDQKIAMRGALDGTEAMAFAHETSPLVKFHGCHFRDREETLWTQGQLPEPKIAGRVTSCSHWMGLVLPGKDLLVIGFWTDWGYLNDVFANALNVAAFGSVTVVDPAPSGDLQTKAPNLWARLSGGTANFRHIQASGADALDELRTEFSKVWLKRFYAMGQALLVADGKTYSPISPNMTGEDLYNSRRDAEGVPYNRAAHMKQPPVHAEEAAFCHHLLLQASATRNGSWYDHGGRRIRVVQGAGQSLNVIRQRYKEPPALPQPDLVVCAGSVNPTTPGRIIATGAGASIIRPAPGGTAPWITLEEARGELSI